jgi:hypothetical protein
MRVSRDNKLLQIKVNYRELEKLILLNTFEVC